jgi:SAM-dependent methyltransferase
MTQALITEADVIRTLEDGTYTLHELYERVAVQANIARDRGLEPPDEQHPTDRVWRRRVRGMLQTLRSSGNASRIGASVWAIRGAHREPQQLVLIARGGRLAHVELLVRGAALLLSTLDEPADLVLCDPPYGLQRGTSRSSATRNYRRDHSQVVPGYVDVPEEEYADFTFGWVTAAAGALRPGGTLAVITGPQRAAIVQYAAEQAGLFWLNNVAAFKQFALRTTRRFACSHWTITLMCRGRPDSSRRVFNTPGDLPKARSHADYPLDWWPENGRADRPGLLRYDNSLPGPLVARTIEACSNRGSLVVDPCVGSGTTAVEALRLGRRFIGSDINPHAVAFSAARLLAEHAWPADAHLFTTATTNPGQRKGDAALHTDPDPIDMLDALEDENERTVIEIAVSNLVSKGCIDEPDAELIDTLRRLHAADALCQTEVTFTGDPVQNMHAAYPGEHLAGLYEDECRERWEREEAERWSCPCGFTFGLYPWHGEKVSYYTLAQSGVFDRQVEECPRCTRNLEKARAELTQGQLGFTF